MGRLLLVLLLLLPACSSNRPARNSTFPPQGEFYDREELREFFEASGSVSNTEMYIIGAGDHLEINFPLHRDLTMMDLIVRPDGRISLPYLGDIMAAGQSPMQLDSVLTDRFSDILKNPEISVIVRGTTEKMVYVMGEVGKAGAVPAAKGLSLVQALSEAGGFREGAKQENVVVIRRVEPSRIIGVEVNVKDILEGKSLMSDLPLRGYDIVYVPKTRLKSASEFARALSDILKPPFDMVTKGWQIVNLRNTILYYSPND